MSEKIKENAGHITQLEKRLDETEHLLVNMQEKLIEEEAKNLRNNIIVLNIPCHPKAIEEKRKETPLETKAQFMEHILKPIGMEAMGRDLRARRLLVKDDGDDDGRPPFTLTQVILDRAPDKIKLFSEVARRGSLAKGISLKQEFPIAVKSAIQEAEKRAHEIRTDEALKKRKLKTRVMLKGASPIIQIREKDKPPVYIDPKEEFLNKLA